MVWCLPYYNILQLHQKVAQILRFQLLVGKCILLSLSLAYTVILKEPKFIDTIEIITIKFQITFVYFFEFNFSLRKVLL